MKVCPRCGYLAPDEANFCPKCGYPLSQPPYSSQPMQPSPFPQPPYPPPQSSPQSVPPQLPPYQQPSKEKRFPKKVIIGAVGAVVAVLLVFLVVLPLFSGPTLYLIQPSTLSSNLGGSWHVDENRTFNAKISDSQAVITFANGTKITITSEGQFIRIVERYGGSTVSSVSSQVIPEASLGSLNQVLSNISSLTVEVLNSSNGQYAIAVCLQAVPNSYYASQISKLSAQFSQYTQEISYLASAFGADTYTTSNAIGIAAPKYYPAGYQIMVFAISGSSLKIASLYIYTTTSVTHSDLVNIVNAFSSSV